MLIQTSFCLDKLWPQLKRGTNRFVEKRQTVDGDG
jgi:hypothetical protein